MIKTEQQTRTMVLGETDGFRYIGVRPPLTPEELRNIPYPSWNFEGKELIFHPTSIEHHSDNSMDIGFNSEAFVNDDEAFIEYAERVASHLGGCSLDKTVHYIGPGSVIGQAAGELPAY